MAVGYQSCDGGPSSKTDHLRMQVQRREDETDREETEGKGMWKRREGNMEGTRAAN